jgi:hypothetical protein
MARRMGDILWSPMWVVAGVGCLVDEDRLRLG